MLEVSAKYDSRKPGFALVVALALMGLVLALIISMTLMIQVETQATSSAMEHLRAKESAQLALMVAIGELQKHAGPDQRVTARAEILGSTVQNGERYWTGSWNTNDPSAPPIWLVSGQTPDPTSPSANLLPLVGSHSVDLTQSTYTNQYVSAPAQKIIGADGKVAEEIAWWVSGEATKASIGTLPLNSRGDLNFLDRQETSATELLLANLQGIDELFEDYDRFDSSDVAGQDHMHSLSDLFHNDAFSNTGTELLLNTTVAPFHILTTASYGVLANTLPSSEVDAGLMRDLSLYPSLLGYGLEQYIKLGEINQDRLRDTGIAGRRLFTEIKGLDDLQTLNDGDIAMPIAPILSNLMIAFSVRSESPAVENPNFYLRMRFFCEFWNPFTHSLLMENSSGNPVELELEITGLPTITVRKTTGTLASSSPVDIQSLIGDPSVPNKPATIQLKYDHSESWLPGQSKNWNGVDATLAKGHSPYVSIDRYSKLIGDSNHNLGGATGLDTGVPRLTANIRHTSTGTNDIGVIVYLRDTVTGLRKSVSELNGFNYEPVSTRPSGYSNKHSGATFGYHILLRSPHHSSNDAEYYKGRWLYDHDPRNPQPDLNVNWYQDNDPDSNTGSAYVPVKDGVVPITLPIPEEISETTNTLEISDFRRLHDRSAGQFGSQFNKLWQDIPLFELPRQRIFTLASLQHAYFHNERPNKIGNSWGSKGRINTAAWFDRYYFSGFSKNDNPADYDPRAGPPNPVLQLFSELLEEQLAQWQQNTDIQNASLEPAENLLVANRFNINSTSISAWKAVLGSLRLNDWDYLDYPEDDTSDLSSLKVSSTNRNGMFARFSHSLSETYEATETPAFEGSEPVAPSAFYRHGARRLSNDQLHNLATEVVALLKHKATPFISMEEFISEGNAGSSLLEQAIANVIAPTGRQQWHHAWELNGNELALTGNSIDIDHFSPGFLTQADVLTAIGPMLATRSDTFKIRARSRTYNSTASISNGAMIEAIVQRIPDSIETSATNDDFGRKFKIISARWMRIDEI